MLLTVKTLMQESIKVEMEPSDTVSTGQTFGKSLTGYLLNSRWIGFEAEREVERNEKL